MTPATRSVFGDALRSALDETGVSLKELSRRLVRNGDSAEAKRRLLHRYLRGEVTPGDEMRFEIATALALPADRFTEDRIDRERHRRVMNALSPLADELLALIAEARAPKVDA